MDWILCQLFRKIKDGYRFIWTSVDAYSTAYAQLFINQGFLIFSNNNAFLVCSVHRAYSNAEIVSASHRIASFFLYDCYSFGHNLRSKQKQCVLAYCSCLAELF